MPFSSGWGNWMMGSDANALFLEDFESNGAGTTDLFHSFGTETLQSLAAWATVSGTTPLIAANIVSPNAGASYRISAGHPDWANALGVYRKTFRVQWATGQTAYVYAHLPSNTDFIRAALNATGIALQKDVGGVSTVINTAAFAPVNATWYWLEIVDAGDGQNWTVNLYQDNPAGTKGALIVTCSGAANDPSILSGPVGLEASGVGINFGGAFADVAVVSGPLPANWNTNNQTSWAVAGEPAYCWSQTQSHNGLRSLSITRVANSTGFAQIALNTTKALAIQPGYYVIAGYAKGVGLSANTFGIDANWLAANRAYISSPPGATPVPAGNTGWVRYSSSSALTPSNAAYIRPILPNFPAGVTGTIYVDTCIVTRQDWLQAWSETPPQEAVIG